MSIRVLDLEKRHPGSDAPALRGVSMHVPEGQVASVLGESGAGKSTLLRCLVGALVGRAGVVRRDGQIRPSIVRDE